jgi:sulfopyruvate decarboxylase subunit alpha
MQRASAEQRRREQGMPVSAKHSQLIFDALKAANVQLMSALPETWLVHIIRLAEDDPDTILVRLAKEEEGVGISAGAHLAGMKSAMLMQNHGFLASVNGIVSLAQLYKIPLLMLISHRGDLGESDPWQCQGGMATVPVLDALHIPHYPLDDPAKVHQRILAAQCLAESALTPVALLLARELMWEET